MTRHLFLSPHLDDVALSCGASVAAAQRQGVEVSILTVFAGDEPATAASPLVEQIYTLWGLAAGSVMATRREEDREAARLLGATAEHWGEQEAIHRRDPLSGVALYPNLPRLFGPPAAAEEALVATLTERLRSLPPVDRRFVPLGVGGHVDHRILRLAAERAFGATIDYYEEFPYVVWKLFALRRARGPRRGWRSQVAVTDSTDAAAKRAAILAYGSQIRPLFRDPRGLDRLLARQRRRGGGERFWRRRVLPDRPSASPGSTTSAGPR